MYCFFDDIQKREAINISPGEFFASGKGMPVHTLIGTGVSVVLFDPVRNFGGINNFAVSGLREIKENEAEGHGIAAMDELINGLLKNGSLKKDLQAKLLGGSELPEAEDAALRNIRFAVDYLGNNNIEIIGRSTGGNEIRKIYYYPDCFRILIKKLKYPNSDHEKQMDEYCSRLRKKAWKR